MEHRSVQSLQDVVSELERIIEWAHGASSRIGFFAAIYKRVTLEIERMVRADEFAEAETLVELDIDFADRYLSAVQAHREGRRTSRSWQVAFAASGDRRLLIVQHLLLGISAHINFDLGISCARVAPTAARFEALRPDFARVTQVFAGLIDDVEDRIGVLSPRFGELDDIAGGLDEGLVGFSIQAARERALSNGHTLMSAGPRLARLLIESQDLLVASFGKALQNPILSAALHDIRAAESDDVPSILEFLAREVPSLDGDRDIQGLATGAAASRRVARSRAEASPPAAPAELRFGDRSSA
jgi:hypothetical protein